MSEQLVNVKTSAKNYWGTSTNTSAGKLTFNDKGQAQITVEQFQILSQPRFAFMGLKQDGGEAIEVPEDVQDNTEVTSELQGEQDSEIQGEVISEVTQSDNDEVLDKQVDQELVEQIKALTTLKELKEAAETLELPKDKWEDARRKETLRQYILESL